MEDVEAQNQLGHRVLSIPAQRVDRVVSFCAAKSQNNGPYTPQHYLVTFVFSNPYDIIVYLRTTLVKNTYKRSKKIPKKCEQSNKRGLLPENSSLLLKCAAVQRMETRNVDDDEEAPKGSQSWLRDLWSQ